MQPYLGKAYDIFMLSRPLNAVLPLFLVGIGAIYSGVAIEADGRIYFALAALLFVHGATTMVNDLEDIEVDRRNHVSTILTRGLVGGRTVRLAVILQLVLAGICLIFLPPLAWLIVLALVGLGWAYNARPFQLSRRPIASMVVMALSYGFLPVLLGVSLGTITGWTVLLGLLWSVSRVSLSILKDYKDAVGDAASNKRTFLLVYGHRKVRVISLAAALIGNSGALTLLWLAASRGESLWCDLVALGMLGAIVSWRMRLFTNTTYDELNAVFHQCLAIQLGVEGVVVLWLIMPFIS